MQDVAAFAYDAVATLALTLDAADTPPIRGDVATSNAFLAHLANMSFDGATGRISFVTPTLDRDPSTVSFVLYSVVRSGSIGISLVPVASMTGATVGTCRQTHDRNKQVTNSTAPPAPDS